MCFIGIWISEFIVYNRETITVMLLINAFKISMDFVTFQSL